MHNSVPELAGFRARMDNGERQMVSGAALMLAAWCVEALFGYPAWLQRHIAHPVVWLGALIDALDRACNRPTLGNALRYGLGMVATLVTVAVAAAAGLAVSLVFPPTVAGWCAEALVASSLICSRSLYAHVTAVVHPLACNDLAAARGALAGIVGRDTAHLPQEGIAGAALESLAESACDGIVAPLFWGVLLGLPGLAAYKAVNTLDSMIGHRSERFAAFGGFAARLDDAANYLPARLTGLLLALASGRCSAFRVMWRDARRHRSPNAGWPESAAAGALAVRLSGPRSYGGARVNEPWLNGQAGDPGVADLRQGLRLYGRAMVLGAVLLATIVLLQIV